MGTVVVTFFLIARFYVSKMDADFKEKRRKKIDPNNREKRWSMNSQRLEEIVAELMRPMRDLRHSFDTDLSALLEEYLTEAGLHALAAEAEDEEEDGVSQPSGSAHHRHAHAPLSGPNFAELALLLQQSASIYGRKVDFLYQHVLSVSDSLHNSTMEIANTTTEEESATPMGAGAGARRKRRHSGPHDFSPITLESWAGAKREAGAARPPPTLPRMYIELEPRAPEGDDPLRDYAGEPVGVLADFHVAWRLQHGLLVEELEGWEERQALRPIPLLELQAAISANAPPSPPPLPRDDSPPPPEIPPDMQSSTDSPPSPEPGCCSTPLPADMPPPPPAPPKRERKRKSTEDLNGRSFKLLISTEMRAMLSEQREFDGAAAWVRRVVAARARALQALREALVREAPLYHAFKGFDYLTADISGFPGWSVAEGEAAEAAMGAARAALRASARLGDDSDDDGFFELSSLGDSDDSLTHTQIPTATAQPEKTEAELAEAAEWAAWRARTAARAAAGESAPPLDVRALAAAVLRRVPPPPAPPKPFAALLTDAAHEDTDVSRLFLATLFLANAGNVEVIQGAPLSLNSFSLKLLSTDERLYSAAAAADPISAPPPPPPPAPALPASSPAGPSAVRTYTPARTKKK